MGSRSRDIGAEISMHSFTVDCDAFSNEEKVALFVLVKSVEATGSVAMLPLSFYYLSSMCLMKRLGRSAQWLSVGNISGGCLLNMQMSDLFFKCDISCVHKL